MVSNEDAELKRDEELLGLRAIDTEGFTGRVAPLFSYSSDREGLAWVLRAHQHDQHNAKVRVHIALLNLVIDAWNAQADLFRLAVQTTIGVQGYTTAGVPMAFADFIVNLRTEFTENLAEAALQANIHHDHGRGSEAVPSPWSKHGEAHADPGTMAWRYMTSFQVLEHMVGSPTLPPWVSDTVAGAVDRMRGFQQQVEDMEWNLEFLENAATYIGNAHYLDVTTECMGRIMNLLHPADEWTLAHGPAGLHEDDTAALAESGGER